MDGRGALTSKKVLKAAMIARANKKVDTKPERQFKAYAESRKMELIQDVKVVCGGFDFQLDFAHSAYHTFDYEIEIDGPYHDSGRQLAKSLWKDALKNRQGLKVVHIPAILTNKKWWPYLDQMLPKALLSVSPTVYVIA